MDKRLKVYELLVNRVPGIKERYHKKRDNGGSRLIAWLCLIGLNISYYIFRNKKLKTYEKYPYYEEKLLPADGRESLLSAGRTAADLAAALSAYDVISFDVFDTLIFRPFSRPTDLFFVLGNELEYPDFRNIRMICEHQARKKKNAAGQGSEVTIRDIYEELNAETGIFSDAPEVSYEKELELEYKFCFANPYMLEVVRELKKLNKRLVITSDMYLLRPHLEHILRNAGYPEFDEYYISCEIGRSKSTGDLYDIVKENEKKATGTKDLKFAHVGDNRVSDLKNAEAHGFTAFYYQNVNDAGKNYRPYDMSEITGSIYRGLVNTHIHNGLKAYSCEYEYGYIYGGLFVTGYCKFIHDLVKKDHIDKILFLSRDGYILQQAYNLLYPEDTNTQYVLWSRLAAAKLTAGHFKFDYFRRFLYHKVDQGIPLKKIFSSMEIDGLLDGLCADVKGFTPDTTLTDKNVDKVKAYLLSNWEAVLESYKEQTEAARLYYEPVFKDAGSAAAVDIGWAGSGAITLDYMVNKVWGFNCTITGIVAGTNTCSNAEPDFSETYLQSGKMAAYLYSQRENRDIWKFHDAGKGHNLYLEALLDAPGGSLKGFYPDADGNVELKFKQDNNDKNKIAEIHRGILDFVSQWKAVSPKTGGLDVISGRDAYAPFLVMENIKNKKFLSNILDVIDEIGI